MRIVVAEGRDLVRSGLVAVLTEQPDFRVIAQTGRGCELVRLIAETTPDIVIMELHLPGGDGTRLIREIHLTAPDTGILVVTEYDLDEYALGALRSGASGFLSKSMTPDELIRAVRAIARGGAVVSPRMTRVLLDSGALVLRNPPARGRLDALTRRERQVLALIGAGLNNSEIAARLQLSESTVKTHVGRVLLKLQLRDRVSAVICAFEEGLV